MVFSKYDDANIIIEDEFKMHTDESMLKIIDLTSNQRKGEMWTIQNQYVAVLFSEFPYIDIYNFISLYFSKLYLCLSLLL
jgi:hypothetical protein